MVRLAIMNLKHCMKSNTYRRVYDERIAKDPTYPSELPSTGDSPEYLDTAKRYQRSRRRDSPMGDVDRAERYPDEDIVTSFAPPGYEL